MLSAATCGKFSRAFEQGILSCFFGRMLTHDRQSADLANTIRRKPADADLLDPIGLATQGQRTLR